MQLARFTDAFARALLADEPLRDASPELARLIVQPGFAVYRNTVLKGCVDAIEANFPAVARLVGSEWMRAAATLFARGHLPTHPTLLDYGSDFPDFLAAFEPAAELPYLPGVARLDRLWIEAHCAAADCLLSPGALAGRDPAELHSVSLVLHPATRWRWFDAQPIYTVWSSNRAEVSAVPDDLEWTGQGALITRPGSEVRHRQLTCAGTAFLSACAAQRPLETATRQALCADPETDLATLLFELFDAGAFSALRTRPPEESD